MADSTTIQALNAYNTALKMAEQSARTGVIPQANGAANPEAAGQFWNLVSTNVDDAINANYRGEAAGIGSLSNKVSATDLSIAVNNAEMTLRTITAIRDRVITAYQDIIKMPI